MYMYTCNVMRSEPWGGIGNIKYVSLGNNRCTES